MNELSANRIKIPDEIARRRTFAIISHPDAGKTTLTEKLLLFGGAINEAGAVKSNKIKNDLIFFGLLITYLSIFFIYRKKYAK